MKTDNGVEDKMWLEYKVAIFENSPEGEICIPKKDDGSKFRLLDLYDDQ